MTSNSNIPFYIIYFRLLFNIIEGLASWIRNIWGDDYYRKTLSLSYRWQEVLENGAVEFSIIRAIKT